MKGVVLLMFVLLGIPFAFAAEPPLVADGASVNVKLVNQQPDPASPGEKVDVRLMFENAGSAAAENVEVELLPGAAFVVLDREKRSIGTLRSRQTGDAGSSVKYVLQIKEGIADGSYPFSVRYRSKGGVMITKELEAIHVRSTVSVVSVKHVKVPEPLEPGKEGLVSVVLRNDAASAVQDLTATLVTMGTAFTPAGGTNVRFISRLQSGEEKSVNYTLAADAEAASRMHGVVLQLEYQDIAGTKRAVNATMGVPVYAEPRYVLALEDTEVFSKDDTGEMVVSISNVGTSNIRFLVVEVREAAGYVIVSSPAVYVGNLESDDFETAAFTLHADTKEVRLPVQLRLSFADDYNRQMVREETLVMPLYEKKMAKRFGLVEKQGSIAVTLASVAVEVLLLVFTAFMLIDNLKQRVQRYRKILWSIAILTVIGAFVYYVAGRRKE